MWFTTLPTVEGVSGPRPGVATSIYGDSVAGMPAADLRPQHRAGPQHPKCNTSVIWLFTYLHHFLPASVVCKGLQEHIKIHISRCVVRKR